jgi:FAD binding domain
VKTTLDIQIATLRTSLNGKVIGSDDPGYDDVRRVFFTGFDRRPAAIVRVADAADVTRVVTVARETGAELAVRSGGHSRAGHGTSEAGIVLDLSMFAGPEGPRQAFSAGTNILVDELPARAAETILEHLETATAAMAGIQLRVLGGAMARVPGDATAFGHRGRSSW